MNPSFISSTSLDSAVAASATPSTPHESHGNPASDPTLASNPHPLEEEHVSASQSIEKLEQDVVSEVEAHLAQSATTSSPKRPRSNDAASSVIIPTISEVVVTSGIPNGVEDIDPEHNHISNHVQIAIDVPSVADTTACQRMADGRAQNAQASLSVPAEHPTSMQLDTSVPVHTVALTVDPTGVHQQNILPDLMPAASTAQAIVNTSEIHVDHQPPAKKKRKTYSTEEERRQARILKNRRTAEESRQRRLKRMKELEEIAVKAEIREKELLDEIRLGKEQLQQAVKVEDSLRTALQHKDAEIAHRDSQLAQRELELAQKHEEIERLHEKLALN